MHFALRQIPNAILALFAVVIPFAIVYRFGEDAQLYLVALTGVFAAWVAYTKNAQKHIFAALILTLFFSVEIPLLGGASLSLPAEPLALLFAPIALFMLFNKRENLLLYFQQPIFWAVLGLLFSLALSMAFSSDFIVSAKYVFILSLYIIVGVFGFSLLWQTTQFSLQDVLRLLWLPTLFFSLYAVYNLWPYRFNPGAAAIIALPFFKDHTVFSATFSLFVPLFLLWCTYSSSAKKYNWLFHFAGVAMLFALFISSSRAAWLAMIIAALFYVYIRLGGTLKTFGMGMVFTLVLLWTNADRIEKKLFVNPYSSTEATVDLQEQAMSVTNMNSDVSNLERLNRWKCAIEMGLDRPFVGFGPGTYQFQYFPYQRDADKTYISVDSPFNTIVGRGGSAHSEYLLLFSESGFLGLLTWVGLQVILLFTFFKIWNGPLHLKEKNLALATYLGLLTFTLHSLFNNYLNSAQFGLSWWILVGALLHLAIKNKTHVA